METYTFEDLTCPKCKRKYALSTEEKTHAAAIKFFRSMLEQDCSVCIGEIKLQSEPRNLTGPYHYVEPTKMVQDGLKWRQAKLGEYREAKETRTLKELQSRTYDFSTESYMEGTQPLAMLHFGLGVAPDHYHTCKCKVCEHNRVYSNDKLIYESLLGNIGLGAVKVLSPK